MHQCMHAGSEGDFSPVEAAMLEETNQYLAAAADLSSTCVLSAEFFRSSISVT